MGSFSFFYMNSWSIYTQLVSIYEGINMSYRQGFIDALLFVLKEIINYSDIETFRVHCLERNLDKLSTYKVEDIKRELGIDFSSSNTTTS